tara:strand:- start:1344 stop:1757 length:414 start_codon:yes stop_codon:yes gene_type:complete
MTTIKAKKGEFVNIINGLFSVQELKGKEFSLTVSKNIVILQKALKDLEEAGKPSDEFMKLASEVNQLANLNSEDSKEKITKLEEENKELVEERRTQMDKVKEMMEEEIELKLNILEEDSLPEDITAKQINNLIKIIK